MAIIGFLRRREVAAIATVDEPFADVASREAAPAWQKVHYVPDIAQQAQPVVRAEARATLGIDRGIFLVACVGGLTARKGVAPLISALGHQTCPSGVGALLVGKADAEIRSILRSDLARGLERSGRLWVRDAVYSDDLFRNALSAADVAWVGYRGHGLSSAALWEAVGAGVPVLGCAKGLVAYEIRRHGIGMTADVEDPAVIAQNLQRASTDKEAMARWRENETKVGSLHTPEQFGEAVADVIATAYHAKA
jgi:glycosyltransferase involved in cell wall biosynthesis